LPLLPLPLPLLLPLPYCCVCCRSHYLNHEDFGCMKVLQWKCPGYDAVQPASGICKNFAYPVQGAVRS
jgi:hypothetical protein